EKPMAHTIYEVRTMTELAAEKKLQTQMGTQIHAGDNYRRVVELIQAGAIGKVTEVHVWLGPTQWTASGLPKDGGPTPAGVHWDLWLGPSEERPYSPRYHPLKRRRATSAEAEGPEVDPHGAPPWLIVKWTFPARGELPPVALTWHHGDKYPAAMTEGKLGDWKGPGALFVGDKGMLVS